MLTLWLPKQLLKGQIIFGRRVSGVERYRRMCNAELTWSLGAQPVIWEGNAEMASLEVPGLDVSGRVRARDIQMAGVADIRRRVLMISGAIDATDYDVSVSINLPEPGRWQIIKSETNLTDQTWVAMQVTTDEETTFVDGDEVMVMSRQFSKTFLTPDQRRLTFFDGEVRPGEAVLKVFSIETEGRRPAYAHARYSPVSSDSAEKSEELLQQMVSNGMPQRPTIEVIVPVTVIG
jgi:hypothetical protein